jgi:hypothetical protein
MIYTVAGSLCLFFAVSPVVRFCCSIVVDTVRADAEGGWMIVLPLDFDRDVTLGLVCSVIVIPLLAFAGRSFLKGRGRLGFIVGSLAILLALLIRTLDFNRFRLIRDSRRLLDQEADQSPQQRFTPLSDVVNEFEEAEIKRQLLLRDSPVGPQPRPQPRPESLDRVDMDLAETVTILIAGELPGGMTHRPMVVAPLGQPSMDVIFIGINNSPGGDSGVDQGTDRDLLHVLQPPDHHRSGSLNHAEDGWLFLGQCPTPPLSLQPPFFFTASG